MIRKHFVTFQSPGTFVHEESTKEIAIWDVAAAVEMAKGISERHGATPFAFYFTTRENDGELDSREVAKSPRYYLGGTVMTLEDIKALNDPNYAILIRNMECNDIKRVIRNENSWSVTLEMSDDDVVLEYERSAG